MGEVANMGMRAKVLRKGITDMMRISDARVSGTACGPVGLQTAPESMSRRWPPPPAVESVRPSVYD